MAYEVVFSDNAREHLRALATAQRKTVLEQIEAQLMHEPIVQTKNRKPMRSNPLASWELRIGDLRVYYDIQNQPPVVFVLAIGVKDRSEVRIGGKPYLWDKPL